MYFLLVSLLYTSVIVNIVGGQVENSEQIIHKGEYGTYSLAQNRPVRMYLRRGSGLDKNYRGEYTITEVRHKSGVLYQCNGTNYAQSNDALQCLRRLQGKYPRVIYVIPPSFLIRKPTPPPVRPQRPVDPSLVSSFLPRPQKPLVIGLPSLYSYKNFDIKRFLSRSYFSKKIYKYVWSNCDYRNYHKNGYKYFMNKVLLQINLLRKYHRVPPLKENYYLHLYAQDLANRMAKKRVEFYSASSLYGIAVEGMYYPAASTIVTHWYDERLHYKFGSNRLMYRSQRLTQMLWKDTQYIGIGVSVNKNYLFLACYFYKKGNINGEFRKNVFNKRFWHRLRE
uniref:CAP domain-containing protein (inferred by orthology to a zebrafish protein) n=1 Tax=Strongyloides venezuelensis TaxID=75913 RepID=A0A0K0EUU0_STRVS